MPYETRPFRTTSLNRRWDEDGLHGAIRIKSWTRSGSGSNNQSKAERQWLHGHAGFMVSCYDADVDYDRNSDTFHARYLPHPGRLLVSEDGIAWERIRKPLVMTSPSELYIPDVPDDLRPGDHIEVQWKMNRYSPYGWWYGIVGHVDNCRSENQSCSCHLDEKIWLEFRQYAIGSRGRKFQIRRNRASESGNDRDGFNGGIRKLTNLEDISAWLKIFPQYHLY